MYNFLSGGTISFPTLLASVALCFMVRFLPFKAAKASYLCLLLTKNGENILNWRFLLHQVTSKVKSCFGTAQDLGVQECIVSRAVNVF